MAAIDRKTKSKRKNTATGIKGKQQEEEAVADTGEKGSTLSAEEGTAIGATDHRGGQAEEKDGRGSVETRGKKRASEGFQ